MELAGTIFGAILIAITVNVAAQPAPATNSDLLREKLLQRIMAELVSNGMPTNQAQYYTNMFWQNFDQIVVDPSFGYWWDEVPPPTLTNLNAMADVQAFIKTNGWNMATNDIFGEMSDTHPMRPIRGLPWEAIKDREFNAVTFNGVLYVKFRGWQHALNGVAYNPRTNAFSGRISGFKPIGGHWYVWAAGDHQLPLVQHYEGREAVINPNSEPEIPR
jgi:hypothetical protein